MWSSISIGRKMGRYLHFVKKSICKSHNMHLNHIFHVFKDSYIDHKFKYELITEYIFFFVLLKRKLYVPMFLHQNLCQSDTI